MAISHALPLLLLLFFLPALSAINFKYCNESGYDYGIVSRVEISPNPVRPEDDDSPSFMVFGTASKASKTISDGAVQVAVSLKSEDNRRIILTTYDLCDDLLACPIEPGKNFVLNISEVIYSPRYEKEGLFSVTLLDDSGESDDIEEESVTRMCVDFYLPTVASTFVSSA
ncbi:unnamed protein product [Microthlaspi erraticum]|uniref:MD-2-related lipid-recognition domain-containing protein n=1 Tax=Microthlaspi erraticum TaxID=1685480 RepID=A0A6D2I8H9_9BRAS|nr:unnamed protein product [Microthlaspi erraticum]